MFEVRSYEPRTLSWWVARRGKMDESPPYQRRGGLWSERDRAFLIDSIINNYDIPKIYLADFTYGSNALNTSGRQFAIIDGKQRLQAIWEFASGQLSLNSDTIFSDDPGLRIGGLGYGDLKSQHPEVADRFDNFHLSVMTVVTDEEGRINELFVRLNRNRPLTGAEVRNAMQGVVPRLIRAIAACDFLQDRIRFSKVRMQDHDVAAKLLLVEFRGKLTETKKKSLDRLAEDGARAEASSGEYRRAAKRVSRHLDQMATIFLTKDSLLSGQGVIVPYYWLVRSLDPADHASVRNFLVMFEHARQENRRRAKDPDRMDEVDLRFSRYDELNRSINDVGSLQGRFQILLDAFEEFRDSRQVSLQPGRSA